MIKQAEVTINKEDSLFVILGDINFRNHFEDAIADYINGTSRQSMYDKLPGDNRFDKANNLLTHFTDTTHKIIALNGNLKQLDIEIAEAEGRLNLLNEIMHGINTRDSGRGGFDNYLVGSGFKVIINQNLIPTEAAKITSLKLRREELLQEKSNLI